ncbi:ATP-binding cassette domain-containing protein [Actinomyces gerencseriae]|uniref:ABC transporter ATP-binding protein/permease n=1 Tax=Actinomyces gerencseriae TaxID=52769 RepID=UPI0028ECA757|nr:ATP-binding cassette domain-containing protein [Actinomyces gerencseriae]
MQHLRLLGLWRDHRGMLAALVLAGTAVAATWTGQALLTSRVFAALISGSSFRDPDLLAPAVALAGVLLARPLLVLVRQLLAQHAMSRVKASLRARALTAFVGRSALDPAAGRTGRDHAVVVDGIENLDAYLSGYLPQIGVTVAVVATVGGMMTVIDPATGGVAVATTLVVPVLPRLWDRALAARGADHWDAYEDLHAEFVDSMQGMTTLVAFGADGRREAQLARASRRLLERTMGQLRVSLIESGLSGFALAAVPALVLVVVAVRRHELSALEIFTLVLLAAELVRPLRDLAALWHAGYLGTFSGPRVMDLLDRDRPGGGAALPSGGARGAGRFPGVAVRGDDERADAPAGCGRPPGIAVRGLSARYPRAEEPALRGIDLDLRSGLTAVVGATGSGKSTLACALVGLLAPERGAIELDGVARDPVELLARVALVPQDPVLLAPTVREDIALGLPEESGGPIGSERIAGVVGGAGPGERGESAGADASVESAARTCGIGDDASFTLDSASGEGGAQLSGGQRQRVAIARGLVQDRRVLILDEATSALDPAAEARLVERLRGASDRVVIAITHRLALARIADHVVVMGDGRVLEQGPPDELLARDGALRALVEAEDGRPETVEAVR